MSVRWRESEKYLDYVPIDDLQQALIIVSSMYM